MMRKDIQLFQMALGLTFPWEVFSVEFDPTKKRLDMNIDFSPGSSFACPDCKTEGCKAHDTERKTWRHLNFFQHEAYINARVPRVKCKTCGIRLVHVPWARPGGGFTLLFEAMIIMLAGSMPVNSIARFVNEHDTRLWRVVRHYVEEARKETDHSNVNKVGIDETSRKKGHNYVSVFADIEEPKVLFVTKGKDSSTVERFKKNFKEHNGDPNAIDEICSDMSPAFIRGVTKCFPDASLTFDKFHTMKIINEAVDEVRRQEQKQRPELVKSRYIWLKNPDKLKAFQIKALKELTIKKLNLKTSRAYQIKLNFQEFFNQAHENAGAYLKKWYFWATHSRLEPIKQAAYTIKRHWGGILRWFKSKINNGILEGINSLIQAAKTRARGYRSIDNFIAIIYLIGGKLNFKLPT